MLVTVEMRWFQTGIIPARTLEWFHMGSEHLDVQPYREDRYLVLPACDTLGIKLRQGRLEVKQRHCLFNAVRVHDRVAGVPSLWRKWSFLLDQADPAFAGIPLRSSWWIPVRKRRMVRLYSVTSAGRMLPLPPGEYPERGCHLELTQVHVRGHAWWTAGFEAFGSEPTLYGDLLDVANHTLASGEPPRLCSKDCTSYPEWLQAINSDSED